MKWAGLLLSVLMLSACELNEVVTASSEDIVLAEVYLRTGEATQVAWLQRTRQNGDSTTARVPGARIEVVNQASGAVLSYTAAPDSVCVIAPRAARGTALGSCYTANATAFAITPGQRYNLRIALTDGGELTGTTVLPGDFRMIRPAANVTVCTVPPATSFEMAWTASPNAWVYAGENVIFGLRRALQPLGIELEEEPLRLFGLSVSSADTTIVFPGEFGLFNRFDPDLTEALAAIQVGLPPETRAEVVIGAADRNYVNWERGGNFNPSGLVRIGSIQGNGTGTFGSLVLKKFEIRVGVPSLPPC